MDGASIVGQTLDGKYKIEAEIGKGGMGTVYLATHVGTERPVALKVIASEFMQRAEFVERFRREARAAGRLRHPNVVNVTDFGFAQTKTGEAAYLVMEYLDGCTLGEILEEEKQLPLGWTLDILEQVCSAVQEAHEQGIIHRDLKPDNIWLEPNQRGGYTVKVLDFGIAKLEEPLGETTSAASIDISVAPNAGNSARHTVADVAPNTFAERRNQTAVSEAATMAQFAQTDAEAGTLIKTSDANLESETLIKTNDVNLESGTLIQPNNAIDSESGTAIFTVQPIDVSTDKSADIGTKLISRQIETNHRRASSTAELTRVGAVLGTPLYMSPEQCRGERLTAQSDIYSLGVIAYQMLAGKTPFGGDYLDVMEAHKETAAPPLEAKKVRKKVKRVINSALSKKVEDRPPTAQAFAAELRAESEGIRTLFRRALMIYSEHLGKFLGLALLLNSPLIFLTIVQIIIAILALGDAIDGSTKSYLSGSLTVITTFLQMFCGYLILGTTTWLVTQILAVPLRPVSVRPALAAARRKWKTFAGTGVFSSTLFFIGLACCVVPGLIFAVLTALVGPVVMMENLRGAAALKRSKRLVTRSLRTTAFTICLMFAVPFIFSISIALLANAVVKSVTVDTEKIAAATQEAKQEVLSELSENSNAQSSGEKNRDIKVNVGVGNTRFSNGDEPRDMAGRIRFAVREALTQILLLPLQIFIGSFSSIVIALLYLKTRQVGGEPMKDLLAQFEAADQPRTNWQKRVHARLEQSGKVTSRI